MRIEYFQLIDRIVDLDLAGQTIRTEARVPDASTIFEGHFPGFPLMPGVLLIEAMAQTAGALVVETLGDAMHGKLVYFMSVEDARFRQPVRPGDQIFIHVAKIHARKLVWKFKGECRVGDRVVADATYTAMIVDR
jgi:3-hydroxyacyl-[acyl-carrier-protein] dehydratase